MSKVKTMFLKTIDFKILFIAFLLSFFVRIYYLNDYAVSFAFDQARDAFIAKEIISGDIKILGPSVSGIPGLYHGVLYYYFIAPFYAIGKGDPIAVSYAQSFLSSFGVFIAYWLCKLITKKSQPSLIAAFIFAFSFEASQYANLLSNPMMAIWFVPLTYVGLYLWITDNPKIGSIFTGLFFGLSVQSEIALCYHIIPITIWLVLYREKVVRWDVYKSVSFFLLAVSTMILTEIKFGFKGVSGIIYLLSQQDGISKSREFFEIFEIYFKQVTESFSNNIFPVSMLGGLIGILIIFISFILKSNNKGKEVPWPIFLMTGIAPQIIALPFGGTNMRHIMVGASIGIIVFVSIFLFKIFSKNKILLFFLVLLIMVFNLKAIYEQNKYGQTIFVLQKDLTLYYEIEVIDYTYNNSNGMPFSINTITNPLWINTLWSYLYNWKASEKYGYLPNWTGKNQIGQLGNNLKSPNNVSINYLIIEPTYGIPKKFIEETIAEENSRTKILEEMHFGDIIVQKRESL